MAQNSFATLTSTNFNAFSRKWGTETSTVDPYITGYHFIWFSYLPPALYDVAQVLRPGLFGQSSTGDIEKTLASLCLSVTIPGRTVNKVEMQGLGGIRWGAVGNVDEDTNLSIRFLELSDTPVHAIFHSWVRMLRDNRSGVSLLKGGGGNANYTKSKYAGTMYYWTTKPNGYEVEFAACYAGMFPLKDPSDVFGHDVAANDKLEIDIDFSTDYAYQQTWVRERVDRYITQFFKNAWNLQSPGTNPTGTIADGYKPTTF